MYTTRLLVINVRTRHLLDFDFDDFDCEFIEPDGLLHVELSDFDESDAEGVEHCDMAKSGASDRKWNRNVRFEDLKKTLL